MSIIKAVLGPTNTGKTHYAVDRMLGYTSGMMGFPLRLLAREVYDRVVLVKGKNQVALLTGEERIVPQTARYFLCTAEAMPRLKAVDFVAIDEIQMATDIQRGHVFTEHLLHTRGRHETLFLGSDTMRPLIRALVPDAEILHRPRFSTLSYAKPVKLSRLPRRSAVVGFSASDVYGLAELLRRKKGGVAIVMGALSPRTRNAQVDMYQAGDVDYLVATDAIGMGLNMDVRHISFASLAKFDGHKYRNLTHAEAAQIAGRAGRYKKDGSFSTLGGESEAMDEEMITRIEEHNFEVVRNILWRSHRLDFTTTDRLIRSLEQQTDVKGLVRMRDAADMTALKALSKEQEIQNLTTTPDDVQRLWDVCQIPDFRKLSVGDHHGLLRRVYRELMGDSGTISHDFIASMVKRLDNTAGDIDMLANRIASIRVWTYISHRADWLQDAAHWAHVTRSVEDKLSDALHEKLTQRFVDRRTAVLMRSLRQREKLSVSIDTETNQVSVEGHDIGELQGFSFRVEAGAVQDDQKTLKAAAENALKAEITRRSKLFCNIGHKNLEFDFSAGLGFAKLVWDGSVIATVQDSGAFMAPRVKLAPGQLLEGDNADRVLTKLQEWIDTRIAEKLEPLLKLSRELNGEEEAPEGAAPLSGIARGIAFQLLENFGVLPRRQVANDLRQMDQEARKGLRRFGIRIGASNLYIPFVLKPHATELRLIMWAMREGKDSLPAIPTPGMVWVDTDPAAPRAFYELAGFTVVGKKAVRVDMAERLADAVRPLGSKGEWFEVTPETMGLVGLSGDDFAEVMQALGYSSEVRQVPAPVKTTVDAAEVKAAETDTPTPVHEGADVGETTESSDQVSEEKPVTDVIESAPEALPEPVEQVAESTDSEKPAPESADLADSAETELVDRHFFKWSPRKGGGRKPAGGGDDRAKGGKGPRHHAGRKGGKGKPQGNKGPKSFTNKPRKEKKADPDSPFAALAGLKDALNKK